MTDANEALRALETLCWNLPNGEQQQAHELINSVRAHLTDPGYVRVPVGYAGVTVWIGEKQITQVVDKVVLDTSRADEMLRLFEDAKRKLTAATKETSHD